MKRLGVSVIIGVALILLGVLFMLDTTGVIRADWEVVFPILFGVGGFIFLSVYLTDREAWWGLIPGFTLIGLALLMLFGILFPEAEGGWGAAIFLAFIGLSFWVIFFTHREHWWAIIPGGALFSVALLVGLSSVFEGAAVVSVLFLGLGATFFVLYYLPTVEGRQKWAIIPGSILGVMGIVFLFFGGIWANYVWPIAMLVGGGFIIYRAITRK